MDSSKFNSLWRSVFAIARRRAPTREDAEDAVQEAFLRLSQFESSAIVRNEKAFLVRASKNRILDDLRKARVRQHKRGFVLQESSSNFQSPQDEAMMQRERLKRIEALIATMPRKTRDVFVLHRIEGLTYAEIAQRTGVSVSAVEKSIARAMLILVQGLEQEADRD